MRIAAIFINYRTAAMTLDAVERLLVELVASGDHHVYVVDNDSGDGSYQFLSDAVASRGLGERVSVLQAPFNGGYGYGINFAVKQVFAQGKRPDYFYVINTDAVPEPDSVGRQLAFMDGRRTVGMVGSRVLGTDGVTQGAAFRFPSWWSELEDEARLGALSKLLQRWIVALPVPSDHTEVDWVPGTSMLIRREVFEGGVWFDEDFFLYFEEIDFARQLAEAKWQVYYVADAPILHHGSVSTGLADGAKAWPDYYFDSRRRYFAKYHGGSYALLCDGARVLGRAVHRVKCSVKGEQFALRPRMLDGMLGATLRAAITSGEMTTLGAALALLLEDLRAHGYELSSGGFWAVASHRLGSAVRREPRAPLRRALSLPQRGLSTAVDWLFRIRIDADTRLGRRVRLTGGGSLLTALVIEDDVVIEHDVTLGPLRGNEGPEARLPTIRRGAVIGSGAAVLGEVEVGRLAQVVDNSVVLQDVPEASVAMGVPARVVQPEDRAGKKVDSTVSLPPSSSAPAETPSLLSLLREDYATYGGHLEEGGFWVTAIHRTAQRVDQLKPTVLRAPLKGMMKLASTASRFAFGIALSPDTQLGRRIRIWHVGGIRLDAESIGDDVHLRPNTTCKPSRPGGARPIIGRGVDIGAGACIVGPVVVGDDSSLGANSLVRDDVPAGETLLGVPGRLLPKRGPVKSRPTGEDTATEDSTVRRILGEHNQNPTNMSLRALIAEDFETHGRHLSSPGFWSVALHRLGNARMDVRSKALRAPLTAAYKLSFHLARVMWGIDVSYVVKLGRRVRLDHHGSIMIGAESLGDDVIVRHSVVVGVLNREALTDKPTIGDRVELGPRACIVGKVSVSDDTLVCANTVVPANIPAGSIVLGVPARIVPPSRIGHAKRG